NLLGMSLLQESLYPDLSVGPASLQRPNNSKGSADIEDAFRHLRLACRLEGKSWQPLNGLAWVLATHPDARWRNGSEAVRLAEQACELTGYRQPAALGTLAVAYAEAGRFPEAVTTVQRAQALRRQLGQTEPLPKYEEWPR